MTDLATLRRQAEALLGPDDPVTGAFFCLTPVKASPAWLAGCLPTAAWNSVADLLMSPFGRRRRRAVVAASSGIVVLGRFDAHGMPTAVVERVPNDVWLTEPDWSTGDVSVRIGDTALWVSGPSIDEARRLARLRPA